MEVIFDLKEKSRRSYHKKIKNISLNIKRDAIQCSKRSFICEILTGSSLCMTRFSECNSVTIQFEHELFCY